jgi:predicted TIM-barrel fold metal-dependent hydrolase
MDIGKLPILDCHQHFFDARRLRYPVFVERSAGFESLLGDYSALPRVYLPDDYLREVTGFDVVKTVWAEFLSDDPVGEVQWAQELARSTGRPHGMIALVAFQDPELERTLDLYAAVDRLRCVRQHLGWHPTNPLLRYAPRPDLLADGAWRKGLRALRNRDLACELEIFAPQLPDFASAAASCPDLRFVLPLMGWPLDLTRDGHRAWKRALATVATCDNVAVKIFGMECVFGLDWTGAQVRPWILDTIELFGPERCMFASHMPLCTLACSFQQLYGAYLEIIADFSPAEKRRLLHDTAATIYRL